MDPLTSTYIYFVAKLDAIIMTLDTFKSLKKLWKILDTFEIYSWEQFYTLIKPSYIPDIHQEDRDRIYHPPPSFRIYQDPPSFSTERKM